MLWRVFLVGINCNKQNLSVLCDGASIRENVLSLWRKLETCYSNCGLWTNRIRIIQEIIRDSESQAEPQGKNLHFTNVIQRCEAPDLVRLMFLFLNGLCKANRTARIRADSNISKNL